MSEEKDQATAEAAPAAPAAKGKAKAEKKFQIASLAKNCNQLFGVSSTTFAGATAGLTGKEYSINEMKSIIEKWTGKEI